MLLGEPKGSTVFDMLRSLVAKVDSVSDRIGQHATDTNEATGLYAMFRSSDTADSDAFLNGHVYSMGDYVIQGGQLYQCVVVTSSTSWVESEWMPVTGTSMVKSIQRGTASGNQTITLEHPVNPNRCIVLLNGGTSIGYGYSNGCAGTVGANGCYVHNLTSTSFAVGGAAYHPLYYDKSAYGSGHWNGANEVLYNVAYSWQVVEFY